MSTDPIDRLRARPVQRVPSRYDDLPELEDVVEPPAPPVRWRDLAALAVKEGHRLAVERALPYLLARLRKK